jgi:hypothetical protein
MKESYREGVANRPGPEPCEGSRETALEALDRGTCRQGIELRNKRSGVPTSSGRTEGNTLSGRKREPGNGPAESKTPGMQRNSMRENRETPLLPAGSRRAGRRTR